MSRSSLIKPFCARLQVRHHWRWKEQSLRSDALAGNDHLFLCTERSDQVHEDEQEGAKDRKDFELSVANKRKDGSHVDISTEDKVNACASLSEHDSICGNYGHKVSSNASYAQHAGCPCVAISLGSRWKGVHYKCAVDGLDLQKRVVREKRLVRRASCLPAFIEKSMAKRASIASAIVSVSFWI